MHQKPFYEEPRFHASFAWALLNLSEDIDDDCSVKVDRQLFPTIASFPETLVPQLIKMYGNRLVKAGVFEATEVKLRIGRDEFVWSLSG